ncbi:MAG: hypothetical protein ACKV2T_38605 [Kofleriaceae bacterium]
MRLATPLAPSLTLLWSLVACKADPPPREAGSAANRAGETTAPRRAKLPELTRTNALVIGVQLRAEMAWTDATAASSPEAWDLAADLFARSRDACLRDCAELAYATVLARSNALKADASIVRPAEKPTTPQPMPERVEAMIDAADAFMATAPAGDDNTIGVGFFAGQQFNDYGHIDESTTRFANIVNANPTHEVALYSANLMLDAFNRSERYEDLLRWARELEANAALMATHGELAELVANIVRGARGERR